MLRPMSMTNSRWLLAPLLACAACTASSGTTAESSVGPQSRVSRVSPSPPVPSNLPVHVGLGGNTTTPVTVLAVGPSGIAPSDERGLTAGACAAPTGVVTFMLGGSPTPRCNIAHAQQTVEVVNGLDTAVRVRLGYQLLTLPAGARGRFRGHVAAFLAPGHHTVSDSAYGGGGAELLVRE